MRRLLTSFVTVLAAVSLGGCYVSLRPLVTDDIRVFEPALAGTWEGRDDADDVWTFKAAGGPSPDRFDIVIVEDGRSARFAGELARINGLLVLDLSVADNEEACDLLQHDWIRLHTVGVHTFLRVGLEGDRLTLRMLDAEWLDKAIGDGKVRIAHERLGDRDRTLLTAPSRELQALVRAHGASGLFDVDDAGEFVRRR